MDSNCGPLESEATTLPTEPQSLPHYTVCVYIFNKTSQKSDILITFLLTTAIHIFMIRQGGITNYA